MAKGRAPTEMTSAVNVHSVNRTGRPAGVFTVEKHDCPSGERILDVRGGGVPDVKASAKKLASEIGMKVDPSKANWLQVLLEGIYIKDNREVGGAEIRVVTTVIDGISTEPVVVKLEEFHDVHDNTYLPIGKHSGDPNAPGVSLYLSSRGKIPTFLDMRFLVIESDEEVRNFGNLLKDLKGNEDYKSVVKVLTELVKSASPYSMFIGIADMIIGIIARILLLNKDDQLSYYAVTFTEPFDNLGIGPHKPKADNVIYEYQIRGA